MEAKKKESVDIERNKLTFRLVGFVISLSLVYGIFEYTSATGIVSIFDPSVVYIDETEQIPITRTLTPPPPPQPKASVEQFDIIDNEEEIDDIMEIDAEINTDDIVEIIEIESEPEPEEDIIFVNVEKMPEFPGGPQQLMTLIGQTVKYPNIARETGIQGRVYVRFVVTKNGDVDQVSIARGVDPSLDKEAIRVIKQLPRWFPGEQREKKVAVWYTVPINFRLQ